MRCREALIVWFRVSALKSSPTQERRHRTGVPGAAAALGWPGLRLARILAGIYPLATTTSRGSVLRRVTREHTGRESFAENLFKRRSHCEGSFTDRYRVDGS